MAGKTREVVALAVEEATELEATVTPVQESVDVLKPADPQTVR